MEKIACVLAPMAGITDKPLRQLIRLFSDHILYTEMVGIASLCAGAPEMVRLLDLSGEHNIVVQLVGAEPELMERAAMMAEKAGACGIDINMGCPVKKLISNESGASLMWHADRAMALVRAAKKAVDIPVSAKIRIGWDEQNILGPSFAFDLQQAGVDLLAVHGRFKAQGNTGPTRPDLIRQVVQAVSVPVWANGGIATRAQALDMLQATGASGVMIGQAIMGHPWLLAEITDSQFVPPKVTEVMEEHLERLVAYYGEWIGVQVLRKFIKPYLSPYAVPKADIQKLYTLTTQKEVMMALKGLHLFD